jgi:hypothetical protein
MIGGPYREIFLEVLKMARGLETMSKFLNTSEFIIMINSRHILNLSIELIIKAQALDRTSCYKCKKIVFKKVLKSFRRVLKSTNSLKS